MILVTGANGQLGHDVSVELSKNNVPHIATDINELDITDESDVKRFFQQNKISSVIHCAAYTAVDKAEDEKELCIKVNYSGTKNLCENAAKCGAKFIYVSTDYVFCGNGSEPFEPDDEKGPRNVYGKSKLMGEEAVKSLLDNYFIVRTSWVFGEKNTNFIHTMLKLSQRLSEVRVVCDQIGSPTYSKHLAKLLCKMIQTEKYGEYHAHNEGYCSWAQLAEETFKLSKKETKVIPVKSEEYPTKATRPKNSRLSTASLTEAGFELLPDWKEALKEYLKSTEE